jgi:hypothetical protein
MCRLAHFNSYLKFFGVQIRFFTNYKEVKKLKFYPRNSKKERIMLLIYHILATQNIVKNSWAKSIFISYKFNNLFVHKNSSNHKYMNIIPKVSDDVKKMMSAK